MEIELNSPLPARKVENPSPLDKLGDLPLTGEAKQNSINDIGEENKKTIKKFDPKFIIFGIIGILVVVLLVILIPKLTKKPEKVTLNYWGMWENEAVINAAIAEYEAKNPNVTIKYTKKSQENYRTVLQSRLMNGASEDEVPDIFRIHQSWMPMFSDLLAPVPAATAKTIGLDDDFFEVYKKTIKSRSNYLAVPIMYDGLALFYNKDLLNSAGINPPRSWWELESAAKKLTVRNENDRILVAGAALGLTDNVDHWSDILGLMLQQGGVDPTDSAATKKMSDVLTYYTLFFSKHKVWDDTLPYSTKAFAEGKLAFYFGPSWRVFDIEEMKKNGLNYEITSVPQLSTSENVSLDSTDANLTNVHWASFWVEAVNAKSSKQKEAWKFLEYLASKESLEKMFTAASQIRTFGEIYPRVSMINEMETNPKTKGFVKGAENASSWYLCSRTFDSDGINEEMARYFGNAINETITKGAVDEAVMTNLTNGIKQLKEKYKI